MNVLKEEYARLEVRRNFYNVRAAKTWNKIPEKYGNKNRLMRSNQRMTSGSHKTPTKVMLSRIYHGGTEAKGRRLSHASTEL